MMESINKSDLKEKDVFPSPAPHFAVEEESSQRSSIVSEDQCLDEGIDVLQTCASTQSNIFTQFRDGKRRLFQQVLVKMGKIQPTDDTEYQRRREEQLRFHKYIKSMHANFKNFSTALFAVGFSSGMLASSSVLMLGADDRAEIPELRLANAMLKLQDSIKSDLNARMTPIYDSLGSKLEGLEDLKKSMNEREKIKLDYDSHLRKLNVARAKSNSSEIRTRELKLKHAQDILHSCNENISKGFTYYESRHHTLIEDEIKMFCEIQQEFFQTIASYFSGAVTNNFSIEDRIDTSTEENTSFTVNDPDSDHANPDLKEPNMT